MILSFQSPITGDYLTQKSIIIVTKYHSNIYVLSMETRRKEWFIVTGAVRESFSEKIEKNNF